MSFDWLIYRELNPDIKKNGLLTQDQVTRHYLQFGRKERRPYNLYTVYPEFNYITYKKNYKDLQNFTRQQLERHWVEYGHKEKRTYRSKTNKITQKPQYDPKPQEITFIVPTVGRSTLARTLTTIKNQTKANWRCIVIFDGVNIPKNITDIVKDDNRFSVIRIDKVGCLNHGARVRNEGLKLVKTSWVGFVDDDDALSPYYVEHMNNYLSNDITIKCIIFRMMYSDNGVIPKIDSHTFYEGNVGISFCFNSELLKKGFYFTPSSCEDYVLLNRIRSSGYKMIISSKIGYLVRPISSITTDYMKSLKHIENNISDIQIN